MLGLRVVTSLHDPFPADVALVPGRSKTLIGRAPGLALRLRHPSVSPTHAELVHDPRGWLLVDLKSERGTQVNGRRVPMAYVRVGDVLRLGDVEVALVDLGEIGPSAPEPPLVAASFGPDPAFAPRDQLATAQAPEVDGLEVTPTFVFVFPNRLRKSFGVSPPTGLDRPRILPRAGEALTLFGATLRAPTLPAVELATLATLRTIHRAVGDPIVLAIVAPRDAGREVVVKLWHGRRPLTPRAVPIDERGLGRLEIAWLPPGDYVAALERGNAKPVSFRVGELELAPLSVEVLALERTGSPDGSEHVHARLKLTTFGAPVQGAVHVTLMQAGRTVSMQDADPAPASGAEAGVIEVELDVPPGDATIVLALVDDPERVADVPLARPTPAAARDPDAPLGVRDVSGPIVIEVLRPCVALAVSVIDPDLDFVHHETREGVLAGETITPTYTPRGPLVWVLFAAIVEGPYGLVAWQGRQAVMTSPWPVSVEAPARLPLGAPSTLTIHAPWASERAAAWVMVRDRALAPTDGLGERRLAQGRAGGGALAEAWPAYDYKRPPESPRRRTTMLELDPPPPVAPVAPLPTSPLVLGAPAGREPELVLFADVVPLVDGRARVTLTAYEPDRDHTLEVVVVDGGALAAHRATLSTEARDVVALDVPMAMHGDDLAWGQVHTRCTRPATLRVFTAERLVLEAPVAPGRATSSFVVGLGAWRALLVDPTGAELAQDQQEVLGFGHTRARVWTPLVVQPFASISVEDDPSILAFELPLTPRAAFADFVRATASAPGAGLEALAAKALAWATLASLIDPDDAEQVHIDHKLRACVASLERHRDGERLLSWPHSPSVDGLHQPEIAARATLHLLSIVGLATTFTPRHAWLVDAVRELVPKTALSPTLAQRTPSEAWRVVCAGASAASVAPVALGIAPMVTSIVARVDAAYAAAVLARTGDPEDRVKALATARALVRRIGPSARLASTWDSGALVALAVALGDVGVDEDLQLDGDAVAPGDRQAKRRARWVATGASGALVAAQRDVSEDLARGVDEDAVALEAHLVGPRGYGKVIHVGDVVRLEIVVPSAAGDVVRIDLPPSLVALHGGGRRRWLELDPCGARTLTLTLIAVSPTQAPDEPPRTQAGLVLLRNGYDEARVGRAELTVIVAP